MNGKKVVVGLSGGVDSAVSAWILKKRGYQVVAVHLVCYSQPGCRADEDRKDAVKTALQLKIPLQVLDFRKNFKKKVLNYFFAEYKKGRTPNPDIVCNQEIKFGLLYDWVREKNYDYLATGHYARIFPWTGLSCPSLAVSKDKHKDQTYFLYRLKQEQLGRLLFPLGDLTKSQVRKIAGKAKLSVADKKDSTGICFIGELNIRSFLRQKLGEKKGEVVDKKGNIIGSHCGHWFFTIGQRGGWKLTSKIKNKGLKLNNLPKLYVVGKDREKNQLVVGTRDEAMRDEFVVEGLNWISSKDTSEVARKTKSVKTPRRRRDKGKVFVRIRHQGILLRVKKLDLRSKGKKALVKLDKPAFGVAFGQSAVFYKQVFIDTRGEYIVWGGGVIG